MKKTLCLLILASPGIVQADWLCKEASSKADGDIFYACGHSIADSLIEAREKSLQSAKREFGEFCNESPHCRDYAYTIAPLRTDCRKEEDKYSCYRGLEYTILPQKRSSIKVDKAEIRRLIKAKEHELEELEASIFEIDKLENLTEKIERIKEVDKAEVEIEYLKNHVMRDYVNSKKKGFALKLVGVGTPLYKDGSDKDHVILTGLGFEYDTPVWKIITFKASLSYILGREGSNLSDRGSANAESRTEYHSHHGYDLNAGLPAWFGNFSVTPSLGFMSLSYKSTKYRYNNFGIGTDKDEKILSYSSGYIGLGFRYGKKLFIEIEPRQYLSDNKLIGAVALGFRMEF